MIIYPEQKFESFVGSPAQLISAYSMTENVFPIASRFVSLEDVIEKRLESEITGKHKGFWHQPIVTCDAVAYAPWNVIKLFTIYADKKYTFDPENISYEQFNTLENTSMSIGEFSADQLVNKELLRYIERGFLKKKVHLHLSAPEDYDKRISKKDERIMLYLLEISDHLELVKLNSKRKTMVVSYEAKT